MNENTNNSPTINSNFFTNRNGNTLMKEFEGVLQHNEHIKNLDAVVGFLRASGYFSLRPFLDRFCVAGTSRDMGITGQICG